MPAAAFVAPLLVAPRHRAALDRHRRPVAPVRRARLVVVAKAKSPPPSSPPPPPPPSSSSSSDGGGDAFAGFAAGPASTPKKPRLSRPKRPAKDTASAPAADGELRATRPLGSSAPRKPEKIGRKTAADFIAEGVVDDVDDVPGLGGAFGGALPTPEGLADAAGAATAEAASGAAAAFAEQDIRFGIADVADPFVVDEAAAQERAAAQAAAAERDAVGVDADVTGDGGVTKRLVRPGTGAVVPRGARVKVEYTGRLAADGKQFDSSRGRGEPFAFTLGDGTVIKGWEAGVATMRVGEVAEFTIAPGYAYGRRGMPPVIPGNATLTFEVEVVASEGGDDDGVKSVASFNADISRTPEDIARDYEQLLETREERRKGSSWLQRLYFISPFMSQTGEAPPWWINPNITFFIIAVFTVIGFSLVLKSGAIHIGVSENVDVNIFK